jgi:hypothetical protein
MSGFPEKCAGDYVPNEEFWLLYRISCSRRRRSYAAQDAKDRSPVKLLLPVLLTFAIVSPSSAEVEQNCRFIQAKADREACYKRQEAALAEKRKQAATREAMPPYSPEQMSREDAALKAQLRSICRGC